MIKKKMNVWISCNTLLVHQVTKLRTKSWKLIELGALSKGLTIVTSRGSLVAGRQRRDCSQARTSEMLNEFAIECL